MVASNYRNRIHSNPIPNILLNFFSLFLSFVRNRVLIFFSLSMYFCSLCNRNSFDVYFLFFFIFSNYSNSSMGTLFIKRTGLFSSIRFDFNFALFFFSFISVLYLFILYFLLFLFLNCLATHLIPIDFIEKGHI